MPSTRTTLARSAVAVTLAAAAAVAVSASPAAAQEKGTVYVVHGVPGLTVDVYVNGKVTLSSFKPTSVAGPLSLDAGSYKIDIRAAGAPATAAPAISKSVSLPAGANVSLVANLSASGAPTLTPFVNPVSDSLAADKGRLVVRHTAAAPAVDVLAGGQPVFKNLVNGKQAQADLAPGTVSAAVALAGTTAPVIGPADVTITAGKVTVVYAIGSAQDKTLGLVTQSIPSTFTGGGGSLPSGAQAGSGGLAADGSESTLPAFALLASGLLVLTGAGFVAVRARR
ncbi:MAG: DUF4397 domain-containing protein [Mycobacteriales bacterium]